MNLSTQDRLLEETRRALHRYAGMTARLDREHLPPEPGDVFVLDQPGDDVVEWVVLARDPSHSERILVVPGDARSLAGSADLRILDLASGPLTLRCRFARWLEAGRLAAGVRTGVLAPGDVARARRRCREVEDGSFTGSVLAREVDEEPEYQDWVARVLLPAQRHLVEKSDDTGDGAEQVDRVRTLRRLRRNPSRVRPLALMAASVLLVVAAGLAWRQHEVAELNRRLEVARQESAVVNPVIALLEPTTETRGEVQRLRLPPRASHVVLFLPLGDSPRLPQYRLELLEKETGKQVWTHEGLTPEEPGELRVGLPSSSLSPGEYRLSLLGLEGGEFRLIGEHVLRIESE